MPLGAMVSVLARRLRHVMDRASWALLVLRGRSPPPSYHAPRESMHQRAVGPALPALLDSSEMELWSPVTRAVGRVTRGMRVLRGRLPPLLSSAQRGGTVQLEVVPVSYVRLVPTALPQRQLRQRVAACALRVMFAKPAPHPPSPYSVDREGLV